MKSSPSSYSILWVLAIAAGVLHTGWVAEYRRQVFAVSPWDLALQIQASSAHNLRATEQISHALQAKTAATGHSDIEEAR